jgi:hypothetical protein
MSDEECLGRYVNGSRTDQLTALTFCDPERSSVFGDVVHDFMDFKIIEVPESIHIWLKA